MLAAVDTAKRGASPGRQILETIMSASVISVSGSATKQVTCESCGHQYEYEMSRTANGSFPGFARA